MKARVKRLGNSSSTSILDIKVGDEFTIISTFFKDCEMDAFHIDHPTKGRLFCLTTNCAHIGGKGSEWEVLPDD